MRAVLYSKQRRAVAQMPVLILPYHNQGGPVRRSFFSPVARRRTLPKASGPGKIVGTQLVSCPAQLARLTNCHSETGPP